MKDIKASDAHLIFEAYEDGASSSRVVNPGLGSDGNGWTNTGFEELHEDLKGAFQAALDMHAKLPDDKKGEDYAEMHHNFMVQIKNFIDEIEVKIHN